MSLTGICFMIIVYSFLYIPERAALPIITIVLIYCTNLFGTNVTVIIQIKYSSVFHVKFK